jgi:hypothetical protein
LRWSAYPAEYMNFGVMTFPANHAGNVYEKDPGPNTTQIVAGMTAFNPDLAAGKRCGPAKHRSKMNR